MDIAGIQKRLTAAEALWKRWGPAAYRMDITYQGEGANYAFQLNVPQGESGWVFVHPLTSERRPGFQYGKPGPEIIQTHTVSGQFAQVQQLLDLHRSAAEKLNRAQSPRFRFPARPPCGTLKVGFDPEDGHVRALTYDFANTLDEEFSLTTSALTPLP